jgi:hypothetical protein
MGRLAVVVMLLGSMSSFGQLMGVDGLKKNKHGLYEMSFKDARDAIIKYNRISDINGADTTGTVFDIMKNPIDFAYFGNDKENMIISALVSDGNRYKIMFGEFDGREEHIFLTIMSENNKAIDLVYRLK